MKINRRFGNRHTFDSFSLTDFMCPPVTCAPVYSWVWNGELTRDTIESQILEMKRLGIRSFYIIPEPKSFRPTTMPTELEPDYLTAAYFQEFAYATEFAKKNGMVCWLYDEGGWPSGGACGKVLRKNPDLAKKSLGKREIKLTGGDVYRNSDDSVLAAFVNTTEMIGDGYTAEADTVIDEYFIHRSFFSSPGIPDYPDLTLAESTDRFIEYTHEQYKPYLKKYFGNEITSVFTDEPKVPGAIPYRIETENEFIKKYGFSPRPYLPYLMELGGDSDRISDIRIKWFDLCSELFCENYLLRCKEWSNGSGLEFVGHLDRDDSNLGCMGAGNFNLMRSLRCFDVPGIDVIWRQIFPFGDDSRRNGFFPRHASSAAAQVGSDFAFTESLGVYGNGTTFDQMRFVLGHQAVRGINIFNLMAISYARSGFLMAGEAPFFIENHACYGDLAEFNKYLERLSYLGSVGSRETDIALYYPICDFQSGTDSAASDTAFTKTAFMLEDACLDFDIFDDDVIASADHDQLENGVISVNRAKYRTVIIPPCAHMPENVRFALEKFISCGGRVILTDGFASPVIRSSETASDPSQLLRPSLDIIENEVGLRLMKRVFDGGELYFCFNEKNRPTSFTAQLPCGRKKYVISLENGELTDISDDFRITVELLSGQTAVIMVTENDCGSDKAPSFAREKCLGGSFGFRRSKAFEIGYMDQSIAEFDEPFSDIALGDWRSVVGDAFSGSGVYRITFDKPDGIGENFMLDLGDVRYTAEVKLNGESLGKRVMPPYRYAIPSYSLEDSNTLEITVANTAANQYYYTDTFGKWAGWQIAGYYHTAKEFDRDSLSGGLFGPVKIQW